MGLFTWIATTAKKSEAASLIQQYFEVSKKIGIFAGDPAAVANRLTELACSRVPKLPSNYKGIVLAVSILSIAVMEDEIPLEDREQIAMGLFGMLKASALQHDKHSYQDQRMLIAAYQVHEDFREFVPYLPEDSSEAERVAEPPSNPIVKPVAQTPRERESTMDELIKRMKAKC